MENQHLLQNRRGPSISSNTAAARTHPKDGDHYIVRAIRIHKHVCSAPETPPKPSSVLNYLKILFKRLTDFGVILHPEKCTFGVSQIELLGHIVDEIENFQKPKTPQQLRRFLGLLNFYRRFVRHTADLLRPSSYLSVSYFTEPFFYSLCLQGWPKLREDLSRSKLIRTPFY